MNDVLAPKINASKGRTVLQYDAHAYAVAAIAIAVATIVAITGFSLTLVSTGVALTGTAILLALGGVCIAVVCRMQLRLTPHGITIGRGSRATFIPYRSIRSSVVLRRHGENTGLRIERTDGPSITFAFWWYGIDAREAILSRPELKIVPHE